MFGRRRHGSATEHIGIGSLVIVKSSPGHGDDWDGEPSGVVIARGDNEIVGYPGLGAGAASGWLVSFDELAYLSDGRGPFEQATVPAWRLVPVGAENPA